MQILDFKSKVALAPMAGITDRPMRQCVASFGGGIIFSEMVAVNALNFRNPKTFRIADARGEAFPVAVQLVGGEPSLFAEAARLVADLGAHSIDLNMGCPVKKIVGNDSGAALMKDTKTAAAIIEACAGATSLPVSVKFRKGWDLNCVNAVEFARMCEASGAAFITVHGRTRSQFYSGAADWDIIGEVKAAVKVPVIANGDIDSAFTAKKVLEHTGADGVMIGRAALGAPWIVAQVHDYLENGVEPREFSIAEIRGIFLRHLREMADWHGERVAVALSRKFACWYSRNLKHAKKFREAYMKVSTLESAIEEISRYFAGDAVE